ncbi:hypothetical protein ABZY58_27450 [Micromonospora tulbaghiae]|uniref:hypothetical protein n=1 Tax=Micromonospora tulbaghiae TaxID=479978 RepID=UPI0033B3D2E8
MAGKSGQVVSSIGTWSVAVGAIGLLLSLATKALDRDFVFAAALLVIGGLLLQAAVWGSNGRGRLRSGDG